jgi:hypothetical protein
VEPFFPALVAAALAGLLTYIDLDRVFDAPPTVKGWNWWKLVALWWGFVLANATLAGLLYYALDEAGVFKEMNPWLKGLAVGAGYAALIRTKLTTLSLNGQEIPVGLETVYEGLKNLIHRRINHIIRLWRAAETEKLTQSDTPTLRHKARTLVMSDALMSQEQRTEALAWIESIATGKGIEDGDRRIHLATFLITGQMRPRS